MTVLQAMKKANLTITDILNIISNKENSKQAKLNEVCNLKNAKIDIKKNRFSGDELLNTQIIEA